MYSRQSPVRSDCDETAEPHPEDRAGRQFPPSDHRGRSAARIRRCLRDPGERQTPDDRPLEGVESWRRRAGGSAKECRRSRKRDPEAREVQDQAHHGPSGPQKHVTTRLPVHDVPWVRMIRATARAPISMASFDPDAGNCSPSGAIRAHRTLPSSRGHRKVRGCETTFASSLKRPDPCLDGPG